MSNLVETTMYQISQVFLMPTLALIAILFLYAFWVLGEFGVLALRRRSGAGRPLVSHFSKRRISPATNSTCWRTRHWKFRALPAG